MLAVLIAPMRGRNLVKYSVWKSIPGPHRPYEGSQQPLGYPAAVRPRVLIAPMRGRNPKRSGRSPRASRRPHRPYEGSQQDVLRAALRHLVASSSPL